MSKTHADNQTQTSATRDTDCEPVGKSTPAHSLQRQDIENKPVPAPNIRSQFEGALGASRDPFTERLDSKLKEDSGERLPSDVAADAQNSFGVSMSNVRVHTDSESADMASSKGFGGFAYGGDVFFGQGQYQPETEDGRFMLMHELAHVAQTDGQRAGQVQGKLKEGQSNDALEVDADNAAAKALSGERYHVQNAPLVLRGFGATAKKDKHGNRDKKSVNHENQTRNAAEAAGFSKKDAKEMYSGNWQRDMNQMLIPKLKPLAPQIFELMDIAHIQHFGKGMEGGSKEFGTYDPVEHIDNPGGQRAKDVFDQNGDSAHNAKIVEGKEGEKKLADTYKKRHEGFKKNVDKLKEAKEGEKKADTKGLKETPKPGKSVTGEDNAFGVDESGIPMYMQTSRMSLVSGLASGVRLRHKPAKTDAERSANHRRALRMAGEALHVMQDYYAHSNFCEVALNIALQGRVDEKGKIKVGDDGKVVMAEEGEKRKMDEMIEGLRGKVDDAALDKAGKHKINSYVHKIKKEKDKHGNESMSVDSKNMEVKGKDGKKREVMASGTFNLEDTAHSLKEKVDGIVKQLDPFEDGGASGLGEAIITWAEGKVGAGGVSKVGSILKATMPMIDGILSAAGTAQEAGGQLSGAVEKGAGKAKKYWHKGKGMVNDLRGKDSSQNAKDAAAAEAEGDKRSQEKIDEGKKQREICEQISAELDAIATRLTGGSGLVELYKFSKSTADRASLTRLAKQIPLVGDKVAAVIAKQIKKAKKWAKKHLQSRWRDARDQAIAEFNGAIATLLGSSEVKDGTGSDKMTQPTHTDIAKDFDDDQHGTEHRTSVIEEAHEWLRKASWEDLWGPLTGKDVIDDLRKKKAELDKRDKHEKHPGEDDPHKHQHRHGGAWLAGIAHQMATAASQTILVKYNEAMNGTPAGVPQYIANIESAVNSHFCHPADCQGMWIGQMQTALDSSNESTEALRKEIARRSAQPPTAQAPNVHQTADGDDHSDEDPKHAKGHKHGEDGHEHEGHGDHDHDGHGHDHDEHGHHH